MITPVIVIVGRPNVGKSTLFNRFTRSRNALVSDYPGMTRDRQYGEAFLNGRRFIVIDTGGLTNEKDDINQLTVSQAMQAILEADQILFVVDAKTGLTPADEMIAEKLREFNKPTCLIVNKSESLENNIATLDFHKLGFKTSFAISAAHGTGIDDLINEIVPLSEEDDVLKKEEGIKFAIVGRPNVGKSTLTNRMLGEERVITYDQPGTTRDSIFISLERFEKKYTLIDTAGIRKKGRVFETTEKFSVVKTLKAIESAHIVLMLLDAREGLTDQDLHLLGFIVDCGKGLVIAYNKWDGLTETERNKAKTTLDRRLNFIDFARIHTISALHGSGVGNLFASIDEAYQSAHKKLSTPKVTQILQEALATHQPPLVQGRRIKLRYAHAGGHNPPTIIIHGNQVTSLPNSYKRYLAHIYQKKLKLMGTPIRIELKNSDNPYKDKKNKLTPRQQRTLKRRKK